MSRLRVLELVETTPRTEADLRASRPDGVHATLGAVDQTALVAETDLAEDGRGARVRELGSIVLRVSGLGEANIVKGHLLLGDLRARANARHGQWPAALLVFWRLSPS